MIGMILLAVVAVMIFFGITAGFFREMGVANWVAFLVVLAFAIAAVFPPLVTGTNVSFSYAGFFLPLLLGVVMMFALGYGGNLLRAVVGALAVAGIVVAPRIALPPVSDYRAAIPAICIVGFAGGITAFVIGRNRLAMLGATLTGIVLGDFITALLFRFVTGATGNLLQLGQNGIFDTIVLTVLVGGVTLEAVHLIARAVSRRRASGAPAFAEATTEAAEDNAFSHEEFGGVTEDDDLFDDYFNDDID